MLKAEYEKAKKQEQSSSSRKPGGMPGGMPGGFTGGMPGGMPGGFPGGMPGAMPGGMPGNVDFSKILNVSVNVLWNLLFTFKAINSITNIYAIAIYFLHIVLGWDDWKIYICHFYIAC